MEKILGSCSLCGGDVTVPTTDMSVVPPVPKCKSCGAIKARPVIEMKPSPQTEKKWRT